MINKIGIFLEIPPDGKLWLNFKTSIEGVIYTLGHQPIIELQHFDIDLTFSVISKTCICLFIYILYTK